MPPPSPLYADYVMFSRTTTFMYVMLIILIVALLATLLYSCYSNLRVQEAVSTQNARIDRVDVAVDEVMNELRMVENTQYGMQKTQDALARELQLDRPIHTRPIIGDPQYPLSHTHGRHLMPYNESSVVQGSYHTEISSSPVSSSTSYETTSNSGDKLQFEYRASPVIGRTLEALETANATTERPRAHEPRTTRERLQSLCKKAMGAKVMKSNSIDQHNHEIYREDEIETEDAKTVTIPDRPPTGKNPFADDMSD